MATFSIEVGVMLRKHIRVFLKRAKLDGLIDSYEEDKGFLNSVFYVTGEKAILKGLVKGIQRWQIENGL